MSRRMMKPAMVTLLGILSSATAQSSVSAASAPLGSVVSMFLLDTDPQPLVASYIGMSNSLTTLAINCPPGTPDQSCGYPQPFTITANPSTIIASAVYEGVSLNYGCTLTGTTAGSCSVTYIGAATDLASDDAAASTATGITTVTTTGALSAADITLFPITVTAGAGVQADTAGHGTAGAPEEVVTATYGTAGAPVEVDTAAYGTAGASSQATATYAYAGSGSDGSDTVAGSGTSVSGAAVTSSAGGSNDNGGINNYSVVLPSGTQSGSSGSSGSGSGSDTNSGGHSSATPSSPIATYSRADAYKIGTTGMLGAALLGLAALL